MRPVAAAHIVPTRIYFTIFASLLVLTAATVWVATIDLGEGNAVVALSIAVTKALLVVLYFMHVRYSTGLTKLVVTGGVLWLGVLIAFTLSDVLSRGWLGVPGR